MDHRNCNRARVAISPAYASNPPQPGESTARIHVGHARSMLLGRLIADELGIPFHVRFDGMVDGRDRGECIIDTVNCLCFLGIAVDYVYWVQQVVPSKEALVGLLGQEAADRLYIALYDPEVTPDYYRCLMLDDAVLHAPSLIVRGMEFAGEAQYYPGSPAAHLAAENLVFGAIGQQKHEINVPLILRDTEKMSKSTLVAVHWTTLTGVSPELAKRFLVATALFPTDPLNHLDTPFSIAAMSRTPYRWSWKDWAALCPSEGEASNRG